MARKRTVVIGLLGVTLDKGGADKRWSRWRPSVDLCRHEDLLVHRFELLHDPRHVKLAQTVSEDIARVSPETEVRAAPVTIRDPWDFEEVYGALHDLFHDYPFDSEHEDYLVHITTGTHVAQICLFLLTEACFVPGRLLQTSPPARQDPGGPGTYTVIDLDLSRYDRIASRFEVEQREGLTFLKSGIATRNAAFNALIERIEKVAIRSHAPILLTGPTGAGKSHLARRIYQLKKARRQVEGAFIEVNCATLRGDAAMSALFGHTAGAFTGAARERAGLLRAADGGILFLDEIGELGVDEQAMLLRALEERTFLPLGSDREATSDFQLIAGTNRDLRADVAGGRFREDLLARIDLWTFRLPGLADRQEDIEPNLAFELEQIARTMGRKVRFQAEAQSCFLAFATSPEARWAANFRDLNAAITRMATLAPGGRITGEVVGEEVERLRDGWARPGVGADQAGDAELLAPLLGADGVADLDRFDRVQLADVVRVCRRSRTLSAAGRALFSVSRQRKKSSNDADRLRKYLARYGLAWSEVAAAGGAEITLPARL